MGGLKGRFGEELEVLRGWVLVVVCVDSRVEIGCSRGEGTEGAYACRLQHFR